MPVDSATSLPVTFAEIAAMYYNLQEKAGADIQGESPFLMESDRQAIINAAQTSNAMPPKTLAEVEISSGAITIPKGERITWVPVFNEGQAASDTLETITPEPTGYNRNDIIIIYQASGGQAIHVTEDGNISLNGGSFWLREEGAFIALLAVPQTGGAWAWKEAFRYPHTFDGVLNSTGTYTIDGSGEIAITENEGLIRVQGALSGEVLATVDLTLNACATGNILTVWADKGAGPFILGQFTCLSALPLFEIPNIGAAINAGTATHGFSASWAGAVLTVSCPAGTGATPNGSWFGYATGTGVANWTPAATSTTFGVPNGVDGVDGTPGSDDLTAILNGKDTQFIILENAMTGSNFIKTTLAGFATIFYIAAGGCVPLKYNGTTSKWERATASSGYVVRSITPNDMGARTGTFNGIAITAYGSAKNYTGLASLFTLQTGNDEGASSDAVSIPADYVDGADIELTISYAYTGGATNDAIFHIGYLFVDDTDQINAAATYTGSPITVTVPATPANPTRESFTHTITPAAGEALPGMDMQLIIFRNGSAAADTYAGNVDIAKIEIKFPVN